MNATANTTKTGMQKPDLSEIQKRLFIYTMSRKKVLIKLFAMNEIKGIPYVMRDEAFIVAKQKAEAEARGLDFTAYRDRGDTGHPWTGKEKAADVCVQGIVAELAELGLRFIGGHGFDQPGKGWVTVLEFSSDPEDQEQELPADIAAMLEEFVWNHCTVWANPRYNNPFNPKEGQYRLDTIGLAAGGKSDKPYRILKIKGNTYELV